VVDTNLIKTIVALRATEFLSLTSSAHEFELLSKQGEGGPSQNFENQDAKFYILTAKLLTFKNCKWCLKISVALQYK
jgi:hypothetical protein